MKALNPSQESSIMALQELLNNWIRMTVLVYLNVALWCNKLANMKWEQMGKSSICFSAVNVFPSDKFFLESLKPSTFLELEASKVEQ